MKPHERELLDALLAHDLSGAALGLLASRALPMTSAQVAAALGVPRAQVADELNRAELERLKVGGDTYYVTGEAQEHLLAEIEGALLAFHDANPKATGLGIAALRDRVDRRLEPKVFDALLELRGRKWATCVLAGGEARHPKAASTALAAERRGHRRSSSPLLARAGARARHHRRACRRGGRGPRPRPQGARQARRRRHARAPRPGPALRRRGGRRKRREQIVGYLREHGTMLAKDARDLTGTSRKYLLPLLEYFDAQGITKRDGDTRTLGKAAG